MREGMTVQISLVRTGTLGNNTRYIFYSAVKMKIYYYFCYKRGMHSCIVEESRSGCVGGGSLVFEMRGAQNSLMITQVPERLFSSFFLHPVAQHRVLGF